jgi:hypothetical protein
MSDDATEEMQKECECASEQGHLTSPRGQRRLHNGVGWRSRGCCKKPGHEGYCSDAQEYAGDPVDDRKYGCQLRAVKLDIRREGLLRFGGRTGYHRDLPPKLTLALDHCFFDVRYGFAGIQTLGTSPRAIEDCMAAIKSKGIFELAEALLLRFISAVG